MRGLNLYSWGAIQRILGEGGQGGMGGGGVSACVWQGRLDFQLSVLYSLWRHVSGIQDHEVTGISLQGSSWPVTNYLIKLNSDALRSLRSDALLPGVRRTEDSHNSSTVTCQDWPQPFAPARWAGAWEGSILNQSSVNILDAITSCRTLPNTFTDALGKMRLYQPPRVAPLHVL